MPGSGGNGLPHVYEILDGPSKFDLSVALFDRRNKPRRVRLVVWNAPRPKTLETVIHSIEAEDGSGESWNINATVYFEHIKGMKPEVCKGKIHFRTDRRKGTMTLSDA